MKQREYILITGASRGIGRAAALAFARSGYSIIASSRTKEDLCSLQAAIRNIRTDPDNERPYPECLYLDGDIGEESYVDRLFRLLPHNAILKALVNNAGISQIGLLQDLSLPEWDRIFRTNITSLFLTCRKVIPVFLQQGKGSIVNVSSVWGNTGASCETAYSATKGAVNAFTRALAKELAPSQIRVNAAAFGTIDTDMNSFLSDSEKDVLRNEIGMGRFGTVEEAADLIVDLALDHPYLTGQVITMDGGWI